MKVLLVNQQEAARNLQPLMCEDVQIHHFKDGPVEEAQETAASFRSIVLSSDMDTHQVINFGQFISETVKSSYLG